MTHFWLTGGPSPGSGTDNATVRYYVHGEAVASIAFKPPMATGAGFDDLTVWGTSKAGHGAKDGAWFINYRIPFQRHVRVTVQHPGAPDSCYTIVRGCENLPITVGPLTLPNTAKLRLYTIERALFQPLDWVPVVDLPSGDGLVLMTALAVESYNQNFLEGCYHLMTPHDQSFPGTVLSTGTEDYFDSAYCEQQLVASQKRLSALLSLVASQKTFCSTLAGCSLTHSLTHCPIKSHADFDGGTFRFPVAGETHSNVSGLRKNNCERFQPASSRRGTLLRRYCRRCSGSTTTSPVIERTERSDALLTHRRDGGGQGNRLGAVVGVPIP
eukprot:SAG11_NODE_1491_length_4810_cov_1.999363_7_plen_327_part_00